MNIVCEYFNAKFFHYKTKPAIFEVPKITT